MKRFRSSTWSAFTLIEILIVLAIVMLLAALLFPVLNRVRNGARSVACQSNLHQIGLAMQLYTENYGGRYPAYGAQPPSCTWVDAMVPYTKSTQVFICPSDPDETYESGCGLQQDVNGAPRTLNGGYALSVPELARQISTMRVRVPSRFILVTDARSTTDQVIAVGSMSEPFLSPDTLKELSIAFRHTERANALFADGHSKSLSPEEAGDSAQWHLSGRS